MSHYATMNVGDVTVKIEVGGKLVEYTASDVEVEVEYSCRGGSPARTSGPPEMCDPGDPPEIEILGVKTMSLTNLLDGDSDASLALLAGADISAYLTEAQMRTLHEEVPEPEPYEPEPDDFAGTGWM